jgi:hypothetical protein
VLWTFSDDYATCGGACTHRVRYQPADGSGTQTWPEVSTDATGEGYAYVSLPIESMENGTYAFVIDVIDCNGQVTRSSPYFFEVDR